MASYSWNFGDGSHGTGVAPTYTYKASGNYTVVLTVRDT
ncbi:MAG: PKD domain-containing protein [bacterium]